LGPEVFGALSFPQEANRRAQNRTNPFPLRNTNLIVSNASWLFGRVQGPNNQFFAEPKQDGIGPERAIREAAVVQSSLLSFE
jgi:hypothetical protein